MWGRQNDQLTVTVDRDCKIALPEVGVLSVSGMPFGKLQDYLESELKRKFTDFKMYITMGRLRTITVYAIGEARIPGSHTLSSLSTVFTALFAVGGPSKNGTLRQVRLLRNGQAPVTIDLYDFLLGGDKSKDIRLQDGDTIHVPLIGPVAGVAGNVKRPAIYEMAKPMVLQEVLNLAGGVTYAGLLQHVQVERVENHAKRIVADFDLSGPTTHEPRTTNNDPRTANSGGLATPIQDGDVVKVFSVIGPEQNAIFLEGHVLRPGKYELKPGMRLADVLSYDIFKPQINMDYGEIERLIPPTFTRWWSPSDSARSWIVIPMRIGS
jgi:protein involved in polysaccharide export with SLBB domain